jgi:hypothetical protein
MEIDEYRDYEKALNALKRAGEYMTKARGDAAREEKVQALKSRIMHIEQVSRAAAAFPFFFLLFFFSSSSICSSSDETNSHE